MDAIEGRCNRTGDERDELAETPPTLTPGWELIARVAGGVSGAGVAAFIARTIGVAKGTLIAGCLAACLGFVCQYMALLTARRLTRQPLGDSASS